MEEDWSAILAVLIGECPPISIAALQVKLCSEGIFPQRSEPCRLSCHSESISMKKLNASQVAIYDLIQHFGLIFLPHFNAFIT